MSPAFTLQNIRNFVIKGCPVSSLEGIQNLKKLEYLCLDEVNVTDLSPLASCDFSRAEENGGFSFNMYKTPCTDFTALESIRSFRDLEICDADIRLWIDIVSDSDIIRLTAHNAQLDNETLAQLVSDHPELEELHISWNQDLTDLTPVLQLENLRYLRVSNNMNAAIDSLGGEYHFELYIE